MEPLISVSEAMRILGVKRSFLTEHKAELGGVMVGRLLKFERAGIQAYIASRRVAGSEPAAPAIEQPKSGRLTHLFPSGTNNPVTGLPWGATMKGGR